jgi:hypothetical protein
MLNSLNNQFCGFSGVPLWAMCYSMIWSTWKVAKIEALEDLASLVWKDGFQAVIDSNQLGDFNKFDLLGKM